MQSEPAMRDARSRGKYRARHNQLEHVVLQAQLVAEPERLRTELEVPPLPDSPN